MRDDASTNDSLESAFDRVTDGFASLAETVLSFPPGDHGADGRGESLGRRKFLVAAGAAGMATLAGCPSTITRRFSAPPLVLSESTRERHDYSESTVETITTERSGSKAGIDFEATIESHLAVYVPGQGGGSASLAPAVGSFASPNATVEGTAVNPLATESLGAILAGDVLPAVRTEVLTRLGNLDGPEVSWLAGPEEIDPDAIQSAREQDSRLTGEFLDTAVDIRAFGGVVQGNEGPHAVLVFLARRVADDVGIVAGVLDNPLADGVTDRPIVGPDGHFGSDQFRTGLVTYRTLLERFQVQTSGGTPTPTPVPTSASAAGSTSSSGPPFVIDDFEDGTLNEYSQSQHANPSVVSSPTKHGSQALRFTNMKGRHGVTSTGGLAHYPHLGDRFRVWFRFGSSPGADQSFELSFGKDTNGNTHGIEVVKHRSGNWAVRLAGNAKPYSSTTTVSLSNGNWYALDISWGATDITVEVIDASDTTLGSTSVPSSGDNGDDHIAFEAFPRQTDFLWDYAYIVGGARDTYSKVIDDFEDGNRTEYSDLGIVNESFVSSPTKHGSRALQFTDQYWYGIRSPTRSSQSGSRLPHYPHQGDQFRAWFRFEKAASGIGFGLGFGRDTNGGSQSVTASKTQSGDWDVRLRGASSGNHRADSFTAGLSTKTWYAFDVSWSPKVIDVDLLDKGGTSLGSATISANGDDGTDFIRFKSKVGANNSLLWDYVHIHGHAR